MERQSTILSLGDTNSTECYFKAPLSPTLVPLLLPPPPSSPDLIVTCGTAFQMDSSTWCGEGELRRARSRSLLPMLSTMTLGGLRVGSSPWKRRQAKESTPSPAMPNAAAPYGVANVALNVTVTSFARSTGFLRVVG